MRRRFFEKFVTPISSDETTRSREFILNMILIGSIFSLFLMLVVTILSHGSFGDGRHQVPPPLVAGSLVLFCGLLWLSRRGYIDAVSHALITLLFAAGTISAYLWGPDLPQAILTYCLVIVVSGILAGDRFAFFMTLVITAIGFWSTYLIGHGSFKPDYSWRGLPFDVDDNLMVAVIMALIMTVSWLWNWEMRKTLEKVKESKRQIKKERDLLEVRVRERTKELQRAQAEKMAELFRFAKFGQLSSGMFHDLLNPLTAVTLNLSQIKGDGGYENMKKHLEMAISANRKMENYINLVRKQLKEENVGTTFEVCREIKDAVQIMEYQAKKSGVVIKRECEGKSYANGNPLSLHKTVLNLLANAIEAFSDKSSQVEKTVEICHKKVGTEVVITVKDNGPGIPEKTLGEIFDPFFTTKDSSENLGLGLSIVKSAIEEDLKGQISVASHLGIGTVFEIRLPASNQVRKKKKAVVAL